MKLIRISLIAFAILLLAGCAKEYDDTAIKDRLDVLEEQIKDNTNALKKLSKKLDEAAELGLTVSVAQTAEGKTLTFSDGTVLTVKDGAKGDQGPQGQPGDDGADAVVTITDSADGSSYVINVAGNEYVVRKTQTFSLTLAATELSMAPGSSKEIAYTLTGADAATTVFVQACSGYTAVVDMEASTVTVTAPAELSEDAYVIITARKNSTGEESSQYIGKSPQSVMTAANCFIVSKTGAYKFYAVKGNGSESVGNVASCAVLWESLGTASMPEEKSLISSVNYADGVVSFSTASIFTEGNAVIAAKDAEGNILWSWHIWLTDKPAEQSYYQGAGTMMDRNLGAVSATPGDAGALGLFYQWGRKDPFLGSSTVSDKVLAESTIVWPASVASDETTGTIEYAVANPTVFISYNAVNYDWYYDGTDNTRWKVDTKTIYDPCPAGWRVPVGGSAGVWAVAFETGSNFKDEALFDSENRGYDFSEVLGADDPIWYPLAGYLNGGDAVLKATGNTSYHWSVTPYNSNAYRLYLDNAGNIYPMHPWRRSFGQSVRCVKE